MDLQTRWNERKKEIRGRSGFRSTKWLIMMLAAVAILYYLVSRGIITIH